MSEVKFLEPSGIFADIQAHPPLMREEAQAAYVGQYVDWSLALADAHQVASGRVRLLLRRRSNELRYVATEALLVDHPWLNTLRLGEAVQIRGRISGCSTMSIEINAADLVRIRSDEPAHPS